MKLPLNLREFYDADYWEGRKSYIDHAGQLQHYHGPAFIWHGFEAVRDALFNSFGGIPDRLLDACCGGGDFVRRCLAAGVDAYGFDGSKFAVEANRLSDLAGRIGCCDALEFQVEGPTYDVVTAFDALEHFYAKDLVRLIQRLAAASAKYLVFCIGSTDDPAGAYSYSPGDPIPPALEANIVSGHVTVQPFGWWSRVIGGALGDEWIQGWREMTLFQVALCEDPRIHDNGRPLQAWGPSHIQIWKRM